MQTIPLSRVDEITDEMFFIEDELKFEQMVDDLGARQPFVFTYLMTIGEGDFNDEEREMLLLLGVIVWRIMSSQEEIAPVSEDRLDQVEQLNMPLLEKLAGDESGFAASVENMITAHNQPEVLRYVVESIVDDEEESGIREINQGILIIFIKIVIDCLDG
ncbi:MAG: hypothetical protein AAFY71_07170 [Bacteroidota bacterium]